MKEISSCTNCHYFIDDSEYGDYGAVYSVNYLCSKFETINENESFPFLNVESNCDEHKVDFWSSEFAISMNGDKENDDKVFKKYEDKYWSKVENAEKNKM